MDLSQLAKKLRSEIITMVYAAGSGHPGGSLSIIDILTVLYFGEFLHYDPEEPNWEDRDYLVLSKGHASPALYAVLSEAGFFSKDEHFTFRQVDSLLQGHPNIKIPGVEVSTGSLGQGLSVANGIALGKKDKKVFCILGDGELQEGQCWEAAMTASHFNIENLVAIVDRNNYQIDGHTEDIMSVLDVTKKFDSFGWKTLQMDGHNIDEISKTLKLAVQEKKPVAIIADTTKGKGVSFMENTAAWHGKAPSKEQHDDALKEIRSM